MMIFLRQAPCRWRESKRKPDRYSRNRDKEEQGERRHLFNHFIIRSYEERLHSRLLEIVANALSFYCR